MDEWATSPHHSLLLGPSAASANTDQPVYLCVFVFVLGEPLTDVSEFDETHVRDSHKVVAGHVHHLRVGHLHEHTAGCHMLTARQC